MDQDQHDGVKFKSLIFNEEKGKTYLIYLKLLLDEKNEKNESNKINIFRQTNYIKTNDKNKKPQNFCVFGKNSKQTNFKSETNKFIKTNKSNNRYSEETQQEANILYNEDKKLLLVDVRSKILEFSIENENFKPKLNKSGSKNNKDDMKLVRPQSAKINFLSKSKFHKNILEKNPKLSIKDKFKIKNESDTNKKYINIFDN
jgi:hypothetical protein